MPPVNTLHPGDDRRRVASDPRVSFRPFSVPERFRTLDHARRAFELY
jgi:hypothetical protein